MTRSARSSAADNTNEVRLSPGGSQRLRLDGSRRLRSDANRAPVPEEPQQQVSASGVKPSDVEAESLRWGSSPPKIASIGLWPAAMPVNACHQRSQFLEIAGPKPGHSHCPSLPSLPRGQRCVVVLDASLVDASSRLPTRQPPGRRRGRGPLSIPSEREDVIYAAKSSTGTHGAASRRCS
jgi:hypothetical protein